MLARKMLVQNVRSLCAARGISISALERTLGIGNGTIARWDKSSPRVDTLKMVADYFGCSVDTLLHELNINNTVQEEKGEKHGKQISSH